MKSKTLKICPKMIVILCFKNYITHDEALLYNQIRSEW